MKMMGKSKRRVCDSCGAIMPDEQEMTKCLSCSDELCEGCVFTMIGGSYCEACYDDRKESMR